MSVVLISAGICRYIREGKECEMVQDRVRILVLVNSSYKNVRTKILGQ
jgi:hypothetical protein